MIFIGCNGFDNGQNKLKVKILITQMVTLLFSYASIEKKTFDNRVILRFTLLSFEAIYF